MIIRPRPSGLALLYALRGSVLPIIAPRLAIVLVISLCALLARYRWPQYFVAINPAPVTLLGLGLSIFLGFRNNACYERWWEGRKQWGALVAESRALLRSLVTLLPDEPGLRRGAAGHVTAFAQALRSQLRGQAGEAPGPVLLALARELAAVHENGQLSDILLAMLTARLDALTAIQAACERLRTTPMPFAYALMLHRTVWLFCLLVPFGIAGTLGLATPLLTLVLAYAFLGLDALGEELEEPFVKSANGLPLDALVRVIEIAGAEALGDTPPAPLAPVDFLLL
jgi:ion channel-forming bestrophin family protein